NMANNLTDAGVRSRTALTQVLVALEEQTGGLQAFTDGIITAADAMLEFGMDSERMADFLGVLEIAALSVASIVGGRLLQSMGLYAVAQGRALTATLSRIQADRAAANV